MEACISLVSVSFCNCRVRPNDVLKLSHRPNLILFAK